MADDRLQIFVDNDGLEARVSITAGEALEKGAIAIALDAAGIVHGIDERVVVELENRIGDELFSVDGKPIANATPAQDGCNAELVLDFDPGPHSGLARSDGSLDLLNRGLLHRVSIGDSLGRIEPATPGTPGVTVTGEEIPGAEGKELAIQIGAGIERGSDDALSAKCNGAIHFRPGTLLDVLHYYEHKGNVDVRSGHLDTNGSVSIGGAVNANFEVRAGGDVEVRGEVIGGRVIADGSVIVKGAIASGEDGFVFAGGDIRAKHAQIAQLRSGGTVTLQTDCVGTVLRARKLEVGRSLLGGEAIVETSIATHVAGSSSGAGTVLMVGEPFESNHRSTIDQLAASKLRRQIARRSDFGSRGDTKGRGKRSRENVSLERDEVKRQIERSAARSELLKVAVIDVSNTVNIGVQIRFGSSRLDIETTLGATRFRMDEHSGRITMERTEP